MSSQGKWKLLGAAILAVAILGGVMGWQQFTPKPTPPKTATTTGITTVFSRTSTAAMPGLSVEPQSSTLGSVFHGRGLGFVSQETVNLTIFVAEGGSYELSVGHANAEGRIDFNLSRVSKEIPIPLGNLTITLRGFRSGVSNRVLIQVRPVVTSVSEEGFSFRRFSTEHAETIFEDRVSFEYAIRIANCFEFARWYVGKEFGVYPPRIFKTYIFAEQRGLVQGLVKLGGMDEDNARFFAKEGINPMPIDWVQYMTTDLDMQGFCHEYTHVMIEELSGRGSRSNFKWLDEGLAEYVGN